MSEFELDEEIEVSDYDDFPKDATYKRYFLVDVNESKHRKSNETPYSRFRTINDRGEVSAYDFARKIEPKVLVSIGGCRGTHYISKTLADKIIAGEV